jgi:GntR family transcriptional regulator, histidine utilization repressor
LPFELESFVSTIDALPRYVEIRRAVENAILSGAWPPGHRVPPEEELVARYRCSRMTVNRALSALAHAGLLVRRRRSGTFVAAPISQKSVLQIPDLAQEVAREGRRYRFVLRSRSERRATRHDAKRLLVAPGQPVLAVKCVHFADDVPLAIEDRLINLAAVPSARRADLTTVPPGSWLLAKVPWSEAEHVIRAVSASTGVAGALRIPAGAACLVVERRTKHAGETITQVVLSYPGDRHRLVARFNPSTGAG